MARTKHHKKHLFSKMGEFKKVRRKQRRAKEKSAIQKGKPEEIPVFKRNDRYDWL